MPPELPGFYFDVERNKYFKITNGSIATQTKYHNNTVQAQHRRDEFYNPKRQKTEPKNGRGDSNKRQYNDKVQLLKKVQRYSLEQKILLFDHNGIMNLKSGAINRLLPFYSNDVVDVVGANSITTRSPVEIPVPILCHLIGTSPTYQICEVPEPLQIHIDDHKALWYFHKMGQPISKSSHVSSYFVVKKKEISIDTSTKKPVKKLPTPYSEISKPITRPRLVRAPCPSTPPPNLLIIKSISIHFDPDIINLFRFFSLDPKTFRLIDFTAPFIRYISRNIKPKHRILFGLDLIKLPYSEPTNYKEHPTIDEINRALQLLNTSSLSSDLRHVHTQKVNQFLAHHTHEDLDSKEYSYQPIVVKNPESDHFVASHITASHIFLLSNTFDLFLVQFSIKDDNIDFHKFHHFPLSIHGRSDFSQILTDDDLIHITTGRGLLSFKPSLKLTGLLRYIYYKSTILIKQIFLLKPFTFVLVKPRSISLLKYRGQPTFINTKPMVSDSSYEEIELATYFNDNNPNPCITLFSNHLYINETVEDFQVIDLGRTAEFNLHTKRFKVPRPEGRKKVTDLVVHMDDGFVELGLTYDETYFMRYRI